MKPDEQLPWPQEWCDFRTELEDLSDVEVRAIINGLVAKARSESATEDHETFAG